MASTRRLLMLGSVNRSDLVAPKKHSATLFGAAPCDGLFGCASVPVEDIALADCEWQHKKHIRANTRSHERYDNASCSRGFLAILCRPRNRRGGVLRSVVLGAIGPRGNYAGHGLVSGLRGRGGGNNMMRSSWWQKEIIQLFFPPFRSQTANLLDHKQVVSCVGCFALIHLFV